MRIRAPFALALCACIGNPPDTSVEEEPVLHYRSNLGDVDYSFGGPTGTVLRTVGGTVAVPTNLYLVFYGANWPADQPSIDRFVHFADDFAAGSPLSGTLASYDNGAGGPVPNTFTVWPSIYFTNGYFAGQKLSTADMATILNDALSKHLLPNDTTGIYLLIPDGNVQIDNPFTPGEELCPHACGFHPNVTVTGGNSLHVAVAINPGNCHQSGIDHCDFKDGTVGPNGLANHDAMFNTYWHEIAETLTDPNGGGYILAAIGATQAKETADQCEGSFAIDSLNRDPVGAAQIDLDYTTSNGGRANTHLGSRDYLLQPMWQDAERGGCVRRLILNRPAAPLGTALATIDLDGDHDGDLVWRNTADGTLQGTILNASDGITRTATIGNTGEMPMNTQIVGISNFSAGVGTADILWRQLTTGKLTLWTITDTTVTNRVNLSTVPKNYLIKAVGDFDANGLSDILFQNVDDNRNYVWWDSGFTAFNVSGLPATQLQQDIGINRDVIGTGDFNHTGGADVLWRDLDDDSVFFWSFPSHSQTVKTNLTLSGIGRILGVVDVDRDGTADIVGVSPDETSVVWVRMVAGVARPAATITTVPDPKWRFSGGTYSALGHTGLLWYDRTTGAVARWLMDTSGHVIQSDHVVASKSSGYQLVSN